MPLRRRGECYGGSTNMHVKHTVNNMQCLPCLDMRAATSTSTGACAIFREFMQIALPRFSIYSYYSYQCYGDDHRMERNSLATRSSIEITKNRKGLAAKYQTLLLDDVIKPIQRPTEIYHCISFFGKNSSISSR